MKVSNRAMTLMRDALAQEIASTGQDSVSVNVQYLAARAGYGTRYARYALHALEERNMIRVERSTRIGQPYTYALVQQ